MLAAARRGALALTRTLAARCAGQGNLALGACRAFTEPSRMCNRVAPEPDVTVPLLPMLELGALSLGAPMAIWVVNSGFAQIANSSGVALAMIAAPAAVVLATGVGATIGHNFDVRAAGLSPCVRAISTENARERLFAVLFVGSLVAACTHTDLKPSTEP